MRNNIYCSIGKAGSGKSSFLTYQFSLNHPVAQVYDYISPDDLRQQVTGNAEDQSKNNLIFNDLIPKLLLESKKNRKDIIYDATNYCRKNRKNILAFAKENNYYVVGYVFHTPIEVCKYRNSQRARKVPEFVIDKMHNGWEEPTLAEGFDELILINDNWFTEKARYTYEV